MCLQYFLLTYDHWLSLHKYVQSTLQMLFFIDMHQLPSIASEISPVLWTCNRQCIFLYVVGSRHAFPFACIMMQTPCAGVQLNPPPMTEWITDLRLPSFVGSISNSEFWLTKNDFLCLIRLLVDPDSGRELIHDENMPQGDFLFRRMGAKWSKHNRTRHLHPLKPFGRQSTYIFMYNQ